MFSSRKYPYLPWKGVGNSEGDGGSEAKISEVRGGSCLVFFPEGGKQFTTNEIILTQIVLTIEKGMEINKSLLFSLELKCVLSLTFVFSL